MKYMLFWAALEKPGAPHDRNTRKINAKTKRYQYIEKSMLYINQSVNKFISGKIFTMLSRKYFLILHKSALT